MDAVFLGLVAGLTALTLGLIALCHALEGVES
jgi:hypothetical protein